MFTGLVECRGSVAASRRAGSSRRLRFAAPFAAELSLGESVSVAGVCLSVERYEARHFETTAVAETLARTTLGETRAGAAINLERSLRLSDRLGGHLVTGHVDAMGRVISRKDDAKGRVLTVQYPAGFDPLVVDKGSIAVDGVSLTVVKAGRGRFSVALIPQTCERTTLGALAAGSRVNLEFDLVGKYLWRQSRLGRVVRKERERV